MGKAQECPQWAELYFMAKYFQSERQFMCVTSGPLVCDDFVLIANNSNRRLKSDMDVVLSLWLEMFRPITLFAQNNCPAISVPKVFMCCVQFSLNKEKLRLNVLICKVFNNNKNLYVSISVCEYVHVSMIDHNSQEKASTLQNWS